MKIAPIALLVFVWSLFGGFAMAAEKKPHAVLVAGTLHYSPEHSLPLFAQELERFGFRTTVVVGKGNPEKKSANVLPGIEALAKADVAIFFLRFLQLPDNEWRYIEAYLKAGGPVIGLRTTTHAFRYANDHSRFRWNHDFGRRAMGTPYIVHQMGATQVSVVPKNRSHPIMNHVTKTQWVSPGTLYLTRLEGGCVPLVIGTGQGKARLVEREFGPTQVNESEADIVAWAWQNEWGGKVFGTSFGHPGDFAEEAFTRMLVNSVCWAVGKPGPGAHEKISTWNIARADTRSSKVEGHRSKVLIEPFDRELVASRCGIAD